MSISLSSIHKLDLFAAFVLDVVLTKDFGETKKKEYVSSLAANRREKPFDCRSSPATG
jgi:hypothetical protein